MLALDGGGVGLKVSLWLECAKIPKRATSLSVGVWVGRLGRFLSSGPGSAAM